MDSFRIEFELRPLADIQPWGTPETGLSLSWFGLTDAWYDLVIGEHHLFRVTDGDPRGVDYYAVRLWEDLIEVAPAVLDEIPAALADRVAAADRWDAWVEQAWDLDDALDLYETAMSWWNARGISNGYLRGAPDPHFWRRGDELHVRWRSLSREPDLPDWSSPSGSAVTSVAGFKDELVRFDRALIAGMQARVEAVAKGWNRPEIAIDVDELRRDHDDRATWLARALTTKRPTIHSWEDVLGAVAELEARIGPVLAPAGGAD